MMAEAVGRRLIAPSHERSVSQAANGFPIRERRSGGIENDAPRGAEHCVSSRRIPLHCRSEARIDVSQAFGDHTEFQRRASRLAICDWQPLQEGFGLGI